MKYYEEKKDDTISIDDRRSRVVNCIDFKWSTRTIAYNDGVAIAHSRVVTMTIVRNV